MASQPQRVRMRVATLNVWALPWGLSRDVEARMAAIGARLRDLDADVVAFQEVWRQDARDALVAGGRAAGLRHVWHNERAFGGSGLLVLAKQPFESRHFGAFGLRGLPQRVWHGDYYGGKGVVVLRIATPAGPVTLANTHLHARYTEAAQDEYLGHRMGQVVEFAAALADVRDPVVALGDFNLRDTDPEYPVLTGLARLRDVAAELRLEQPTILATNPYRGRPADGWPESRIDYACLRDGAQTQARGIACRRIFDRAPEGDAAPPAYSDHAGLLAEIELSPGDGSARAPEPARREALEHARIDARRVLQAGLVATKSRRGAARGRGAAGATATLAALAGARHAQRSRRQLLRGVAGIAALAAGPYTLGCLALSELAAPAEHDAFEQALRLLDRF